jgi:E3 ubiquitin-protein ligase MARCH6
MQLHVFFSIFSLEVLANENVNEYLLLQLMLLALLDHHHLKQSIKVVVKYWCIGLAWILDLRSYLIGDVPISDTNTTNGAQPPAPGLDVHSDDEDLPLQDNAQADEDEESSNASVSNEDRYVCPNYFHVRIFVLMCLTCVSLFASGLFIITVPVTIGRQLYGLLSVSTKVFELNTVACGIYVIVLFSRLCTLGLNWIPRGWHAISDKMREGLRIVSKAVAASLLLLGVIPLLIGLSFDVAFVLPFRVSTNQTPILYLGHDWVFGILCLKVICGFAMVRDCLLKDILEEMVQNGIRNLNLKQIVEYFAFPVIMFIGSLLCIPYFAVNGIFPLFDVSHEARSSILCRTYPSIVFGFGVTYLINWNVYKFCHLYEHIKNDKYLVGRRLVNYDPIKKKT